MPARKPWPWPGDSQLDRSRTIGRAWRTLARRYAPAPECDALDEFASGFGETWLLDQREPPGDWYTRDEVARLASVHPDTVSGWTSAGNLTRYPEGYHPEQVAEFLVQRRPRRRRREGLDQ